MFCWPRNTLMPEAMLFSSFDLLSILVHSGSTQDTAHIIPPGKHLLTSLNQGRHGWKGRTWALFLNREGQLAVTHSPSISHLFRAARKNLKTQNRARKNGRLVEWLEQSWVLVWQNMRWERRQPAWLLFWRIIEIFQWLHAGGGPSWGWNVCGMNSISFPLYFMLRTPSASSWVP